MEEVGSNYRLTAIQKEVLLTIEHARSSADPEYICATRIRHLIEAAAFNVANILDTFVEYTIERDKILCKASVGTNTSRTTKVTDFAFNVSIFSSFSLIWFREHP
ncbi:hypothetical protein BZM27_53075 [Paraburkholderia steynii]|uniref:Uncharacterized protein n=1 Tax=Paraburkholderia steynii TaxID=1245441 RepID=A0A4R0WYP9_9BURK|nr:hypothetical protein BZM27_53075 [Paraburkholderia steynii]